MLVFDVAACLCALLGRACVFCWGALVLSVGACSWLVGARVLSVGLAAAGACSSSFSFFLLVCARVFCWCVLVVSAGVCSRSLLVRVRVLMVLQVFC